MDATAPLCVLCGHQAQVTDTDHGNRSYVACSDVACGDYEISKRAVRELGVNAERKRALQQLVVQANVKGKVLEIVVGPDGQLQATSTSRP
jgi:hypothetical protein